MVDMNTRTPQQNLYIAEFRRCQNLFEAARAAKVPVLQEYQQAMEFMADPEIRDAIEEGIAKRKPKVLPEQVLDKLWKIALADPRELVKTTRVPCRCCWGKGFDYQRTPREYRLHIKAGGEEEGGDGYDPRKPPNKDCPECFGKGRIVTEFTPLDELSENAIALVAGVSAHPEGPRIRVHNQLKALELIGKHLGMFSQRLHITEDMHEDMVLHGQLGLDKAQQYIKDMKKTGEDRPKPRPPPIQTPEQKAAVKEILARAIAQNKGRPATAEELQHIEDMQNAPPKEVPVEEGKPPINFEEWCEQREEKDCCPLTAPLPYSHDPIHMSEQHSGADPPAH